MIYKVKYIIMKIVEYYQKGYFTLGIDYLKNNGIWKTIIKSKKVIFKKRIKPIQLKYSEMGLDINPIGLKKVIVEHQAVIDIIICVHNAYEDVKRCIESILKYTSEPYSIILIDDGSLEQTRDYLCEIAQEYPNKICLIRNDGKHGYAIAANIGMKNSTSEYFVLLNSDTIVTHGWLDRMMDCMKSNHEIGIVGPLSNTASWQSVPKLQENEDWSHNDLPDNITVEIMGKLIHKYSGNVYMNVPLLNGFCMLVSRTVIEEIGFFDENNFGKGFGEEDDFNLRALKSGFKLAIADNVYIYHAQSKSYSDQKRKELSALSGEKVRLKHGSEFLDQCVTYMKDNYVLEGIRSRVAALLVREKLIEEARHKWNGKRILFHLPCAESGGGANVIIQESERLAEMGVIVKIYNLEVYREQFEMSYPNLRIPVIYGSDYSGFLKVISEFDAVCITYYKGVKYCKFRDIYPDIKVVYYIQDFEPYFFKEGTKMYNDALKSYSIIDDMVYVTKTQWNYDIVRQKTGKECGILGPSVNIDLFRPRKAFIHQDFIRIAAMIRPSSPRRAPAETMQILKKIDDKYGDKVSISIFGCNRDEYEEFYRDINSDFRYKDLGILNPIQMSALLSNTDIFVDFSLFQAMGLTGMEAMACGCATILPKEGGSISFARDGENCLLVNTHSELDCYKQLCRLIDEEKLRDRLAYKALKDMCNFYPENCTFKLLEYIFG